MNFYMKKLSIQEEAIMQKVWKLKKCTVTEILKELPEPKPPYTTVASVMRNLKQKGYISQEKQGIAYCYLPAIGEEEYNHCFMRGFVHDYFKDSFKEMVCFFAKEEDLSFKDLVDIIREIEKGKE